MLINSFYLVLSVILVILIVRVTSTLVVLNIKFRRYFFCLSYVGKNKASYMLKHVKIPYI